MSGPEFTPPEPVRADSHLPGPASLRGLIPEDGSGSPFAPGRSRVLIVDDDALSRQLLRVLLDGENYDVYVAENGNEALALAALHQPDVVLLDVMMPGQNGYEVCRQLRADRTLRQLHILLLTSLQTRESRLIGLDAGADDFLSKPPDLIELRTRLRTITRLNRFRQLSHERARFEAAVAHSPDGIVLTDRSGEILHANLAFDRIVGTRRCLFDFLPDEIRGQIDAALSHLAPGAAHGPVQTPLRATPQPVHAEITVVRLPSSQGTVLQFIVRDITERRRMEAQLLRSQRIELLGQVASGIVHDVNNILTAISGHASMQMIGDPKEILTHAATIDQSAHRGAALLRGILAFARGTDGEKVPTDLGVVSRDALEIAKQLIGRRIKVGLDEAPDLPFILADANQVHQIVLNLCVNARDAMPQGGTLTVGLGRVQLDPASATRICVDAVPGDFVTLSVRDTGTGIPPEVRPRLFDPFFTTKPSDVGTGLGLATVLRLIRAHDGFIGFETQVGAGTCFTCYFPVPAGDPPLFR
jgi:PAS domain S-box-containing protein